MPATSVRIEPYDGDHRALAWLFRLAEDSEQMLERSIDTGRVWVARDQSDQLVGHVQAVARQGGTVWEVVNIAVVAEHRGEGIGRRLLDRVVKEAREAGAHRVELATATGGVGTLRFYQRCGFRFSRIVRDAFGPHTGYHEPILIDGIPLRDQVWLDLDLDEQPR